MYRKLFCEHEVQTSISFLSVSGECYILNICRIPFCSDRLNKRLVIDLFELPTQRNFLTASKRSSEYSGMMLHQKELQIKQTVTQLFFSWPFSIDMYVYSEKACLLPIDCSPSLVNIVYFVHFLINKSTSQPQVHKIQQDKRGKKLLLQITLFKSVLPYKIIQNIVLFGVKIFLFNRSSITISKGGS